MLHRSLATAIYARNRRSFRRQLRYQLLPYDKQQVAKLVKHPIKPCSVFTMQVFQSPQCDRTNYIQLIGPNKYAVYLIISICFPYENNYIIIKYLTKKRKRDILIALIGRSNCPDCFFRIESIAACITPHMTHEVLEFQLLELSKNDIDVELVNCFIPF